MLRPDDGARILTLIERETIPEDCGRHVGMHGSVTLNSFKTILKNVKDYFKDRKFCFFDVGCASGKMLFWACLLGAVFAHGVELNGCIERRGKLREAGPQQLFKNRLKSFPFMEGYVSAEFGVDAAEMNAYGMPSAYSSGGITSYPVFLYIFGEGIPEKQLREIYRIAAKSRDVELIGCVPLKSHGNKLRTPEDILEALGTGWVQRGPSIYTKQSGSHDSKTFYFFIRKQF